MGRDEEKPSIDTMIDANLKRVYESVLHEDVPDRFAQLLDQLKAGGPVATDAADD